MPRQNFLSRESFVDATEKQAKDSLLSIPAFVTHIRFLSENKLTGSFRYSYQQTIKNNEYFIDVSVLPLNDQFTRVCLHGTQVNGQSFHSNDDMTMALNDFQKAFEASLKDDASLYTAIPPKTNHSKSIIHFAGAFVTSIALFFLRKKLS